MRLYMKVMIGIVLFFSVCFMGFIPVFASVDMEDDFLEKLEEWEEQGIDPNHTEVVLTINDYIENNIDSNVFASLHIDREQRDLGVIVLSFTEEISAEHKSHIEGLLDEHAEIEFRTVDYTEEELIKKQQEIDLLELENEGISVVHTGVDVIANKVEVGIDPYNDEEAAVIYEKYGDEMITVVEGKQATILNGDNRAETEVNDVEIVEESEEDKNWFLKIVTSISNWFSNLF
ncbi:hypothetical protein GMD78_13505 [Ornithinibacillus sp. L9]|uniref:Uncharacterized protein n=1 Tax=Ornithinibacillus caprae TaxID=2678566 RepID=A0A6N8FNL2_9BACI|nr:hypothetical protein [Ornithinibacillus caprae]MUK89379.1 hypothetical protein [Ornithinibacillus caprae]